MMKFNSYIDFVLQKIFIISLFLFFLFINLNFDDTQAYSMENNQNIIITEQLRLKVPLAFKETWIKFEKELWEPWLSKQEGYLGRQIFLDLENEEALILVTWENKKLWKSVSMKEVNQLQEEFEKNIKSTLNLNENPIELIYEGELFKQG